MFDDLASWLRALHIFAFAAWMAVMFYLPRLLVYHADVAVGSETSQTFKVMERRLLRAIGTPSMIVVFVVGIWLATVQGNWSDGWLHVKLALVLAMAACHGLLAAHVKRFAADERPKSALWYRVFNEVPTVLFLAIIVMVVFKPF